MIRTIIIDDEAKARRIMATLLEEYCPNIKIVGQAEDVPSGVKLIQQEKPDLVFLDVEMPGYTGFQLLDFFDEINFEIVFTTAYTEYAIKAFQVSAVDYLLKPIQIDQLIKAVAKVQKKSTNISQKYISLKENLKSPIQVKKIALPISDGLLFVEVSNIIYLKAEGSYTHVILKDQKIFVSKKIKEIENLLPPTPFFRTHRSYVIHLKFVKKFVKKDGGYIIMDNDDVVSISHANKEEFVKLMSR